MKNCLTILVLLFNFFSASAHAKDLQSTECVNSGMATYFSISKAIDVLEDVSKELALNQNKTSLDDVRLMHIQKVSADLFKSRDFVLSRVNTAECQGK